MQPLNVLWRLRDFEIPRSLDHDWHSKIVNKGLVDVCKGVLEGFQQQIDY